jgi:hypothetical protein
MCRAKQREREVKKSEHVHHYSHDCYSLRLSSLFRHEISRTIRNVGFLPRTLRYCHFVFCGSPQEAANFALGFLAAQVRT